MNMTHEEGLYEFGKGFAYCLGLFLCHSERDCSCYDKLEDYSLWFSGAGDHLIDLCTDELILGESIASQAKSLKNFVNGFRYLGSDDQPNATREDMENAIRMAKNLLLDWDQKCSVPCYPSQYN